MSKYNLNFPKCMVCAYRNIFNDNNLDYRHYLDILVKIRTIKKKNIEDLNEKEAELRLILEMEDI